MIKSFYIAFENSVEWEHSADWGVLCSRYRFPEATIKENKVSVVGSNGVIDLSSELTGDVVFNNVQGEINFIILRDSTFDYSAFKNKYHGRRVKIMPDNDTEHYRIGRLSITQENYQDELKQVSMVLDADPFRYNVEETIQVFDIKAPEPVDFSIYSIRGLSQSNIDNGMEFSNVTYNTPEYQDSAKLYKSSLYTSFYLDTPAEPNTDYILSFSVQFNLPCKNELSFEDIDVLYFYLLGVSVNAKKILDYPSFSANKTYNFSMDLNSENHSYIRIGFSSYIYKWSATYEKAKISQTIPVVKIYDVKLTSGTMETFNNDGRKQVVPNIVASQDCQISVNGNSVFVEANKQIKNFDIVVGEAENNIIVIGENGGEVQIKYREAYL